MTVEGGRVPPRGANAHPLIAASRAAGRTSLTEVEAKTLLAGLGIAVPRGGLARSDDEALDLARRLDVPVVLKVVCSGLSHKSDAGGVLFPVAPEAVRSAYHRLLERVRTHLPQARPAGVLVEEFIGGGVECILGFTRAGSFGPVVMFGLGGVFVEALDAVSFRLAPLGIEEASELLAEVNGARCLDGFRGRPAASREALARAVLAAASIGEDPALAAIREVDINPLLALPDRAVALDAVITLNAESEARDA